MSNRVELNTPAPDFVLTDFEGNEVRLSEFLAACRREREILAPNCPIGRKKPLITAKQA
jgi:hypothetical protein